MSSASHSSVSTPLATGIFKMSHEDEIRELHGLEEMPVFFWGPVNHKGICKGSCWLAGWAFPDTKRRICKAHSSSGKDACPLIKCGKWSDHHRRSCSFRNSRLQQHLGHPLVQTLFLSYCSEAQLLFMS